MLVVCNYKIKNMTLITSNINEAKELLDNEDVVAIPTETVYGLAGNIFSEKALKKIYALKSRPSYNPLIVHIKSISDLHLVACEIPDKALKLADAFWPGPLTLILKKQPTISDIVTAGKQTVAVRVPNHPIALELLKKLDYPVAAPSANPFTSISPTTAQHVFEFFNSELKLILDGGSCIKGVESTIVGFLDNEVILYRHGSTSIEAIEKVIGKVKIFINDDVAPDAPGMLKKHYSPKTPIIRTDSIEESIKLHSNKKIGLLLFNTENTDLNIECQEILSKDSDLEEAASNLFAALHRLDKCKLELIIAEKFPNKGQGKTINDRLSRATK